MHVMKCSSFTCLWQTMCRNFYNLIYILVGWCCLLPLAPSCRWRSRLSLCSVQQGMQFIVLIGRVCTLTISHCAVECYNRSVHWSSVTVRLNVIIDMFTDHRSLCSSMFSKFNVAYTLFITITCTNNLSMKSIGVCSELYRVLDAIVCDVMLRESGLELVILQWHLLRYRLISLIYETLGLLHLLHRL